MKKKFSRRNVIIALLAFLVIAQFFRIDRTNLSRNEADDFISQVKPGQETAQLLKTACYDCHSQEVVYPWYTNIAPLSWWIKHHVNEGSHHLNFSIWGSYTDKRKDHKLEECVEMLEEDEMPLSSYTWMHPQSKLTKEQKEQLITFFNSLRTYEK